MSQALSIAASLSRTVRQDIGIQVLSRSQPISHLAVTHQVISVGTVHNRLETASVTAAEINQTQPLSDIEVGLHDEIYQANRPVLVGVDAASTYCYLLQGVNHRDEDTWGCYLLAGWAIDNDGLLSAASVTQNKPFVNHADYSILK